MKTEQNVPFKGRWGYYPCDYETWQSIKELRFRWFLTLRRFAARRRWERKQPQNRVVRRRVRAGGKPVGWEILGPAPEPQMPAFMIEDVWGRKSIGFGWIDERYREAKHPTPEPRAAWEPRVIEEINVVLRRLEAWFSERGGE